MQRIDPNNQYTPPPPGYNVPSSGMVMINPLGVPGGGFNPSYRLPDGSIVHLSDLNQYQRQNQIQNARRFDEALRQMAAQNSAAPVVKPAPTFSTPISRLSSIVKQPVPYGGTGMAPVAKVISSLGRSVAAPFSTAFSGRKINVGTGGAPMVNVFRSLFGK